jgi:hypothetical protein
MDVREALRKGFHLLLLSFGVSAPAPKPQSEGKPAAQPDSGNASSGRPGVDSK